MESSIRKRMISGTKVLWSTAIYVPAIACAVLIAHLIEPLLAPFAAPEPERSWEKTLVLLVFFWGAVLVAAYFFVWKPLRQLYVDVGDPQVFRTHCKDVARQAMPYAPLMALPIAFLIFDIGGWFFLLQLAAVLVADRAFELIRHRPVIASVDALLRRI